MAMGEVRLKVINFGTESFVIQNNDRIAQAMIEKVIPVSFIPTYSKSDLGKTSRGEKGFGSTGVK